MKNLIKARKAKSSKRGIYLQDKELLQTNFQSGTHFKYIVDAKNKKLIILPSNSNKDNKVSKRAMSWGNKPVIDVRKKDALEVFRDCDYLQVEIYNDQIIVEVFNEVNENEYSQKNKTVKQRTAKVTDIRQLLKVKKQGAFRLSKKELEKAAGLESYHQLDISEFLAFDEEPVNNVSYLENALKNAKIPLQVVSLFSGAGLFDLAFKEAGFDIIFSIEKDKEIAKTYRHNLGEIVQEDITKIDKSKIPFAPIVIGGSPCKGFSNANRKSNLLDNPNNLLVKEYIDCVKSIQPYYLSWRMSLKS